MKMRRWLLPAVMCLFLLLAACSPKTEGDDQAQANTKQESTEAAETNNEEIKTVKAKELSDDAQLIDVRTPDQFIGWKNEEGVQGHIKGAVDFPASWFDYEANSEYIDIELERRHIDKTKPVVLYDNDGVDDAVVQRFKDQGFADVAVLDGGINAYNQEGGELTHLPGYERYVSPEWVQELIDGKKPEGYEGKKFQIVEVALKDKEYKDGHIKGAVYADANTFNQIPGPRMVEDYQTIPMEKQLTFWGFPTDEDIKKNIEALGIDEDTTVILYANTEATTAANRAALVMDYAGIKDIRLLNGGKTLWKLEERALDKEEVKPEAATLNVDVPQNPDIVYDFDEEMKFIDEANTVIASVRSWDEYLGKVSGYTYIADAGDIKNSRFAYAGSDPYSMEDYRNIDNTMFNYELVNDRWNRWGITGDKRVSFHCGTGWRAAETYYIADALGWKDKGVYVGGWYEWSKKDGPTKEEGLPADAPEKEPEEFFYKSK